jgi:hypothetical protein
VKKDVKKCAILLAVVLQRKTIPEKLIYVLAAARKMEEPADHFFCAVAGVVVHRIA